MDIDKSEVKCSVGVLTYNSEKTLRRMLESVRDFSDIIISDGGSTDGTLRIAQEYNCTVIEQYAKNHPGCDVEHPVEDFARERNQVLAVAKEDWFFWLDSDEYISTELHDEILEVCQAGPVEHYAYNIPIAIQSPDASVTYRVWKQTYQIRLFNLKTNGKFERKIHEKFYFDKNRYSVGTLKGSWYVPISKPSFTAYKKAVDYRLRIMHESAVPENVFVYLQKAVYQPLKRTAGVLYRDLRLRLRYPAKEVAPLSIMRNRLYSQWVVFGIVTRLYFSSKFK